MPLGLMMNNKYYLCIPCYECNENMKWDQALTKHAMNMAAEDDISGFESLMQRIENLKHMASEQEKK